MRLVLFGKRTFKIMNLHRIKPFIKSTEGNNYILVSIDNLTKYVKLFSVRNCCIKEVLKSLWTLILDYGLLKRIISDRETTFTLREFEGFCKERGI